MIAAIWALLNSGTPAAARFEARRSYLFYSNQILNYRTVLLQIMLNLKIMDHLLELRLVFNLVLNHLQELSLVFKQVMKNKMAASKKLVNQAIYDLLHYTNYQYNLLQLKFTVFNTKFKA